MKYKSEKIGEPTNTDQRTGLPLRTSWIVAGGLGALLAAGLGAIGLIDLQANDAAYREYQARLGEIADPVDIRSEEELQRTISSLDELTVPSRHQAQWETREAVQRRNAWLKDARALDAAIKQVVSDYQGVADSGRSVMKDRDAPGYHQKAKDVLSRARSLPQPTSDRDKLVPGSDRITYDNVFQFPSVTRARGEWVKVQKPLERFVKAFDK